MSNDVRSVSESLLYSEEITENIRVQTSAYLHFSCFLLSSFHSLHPIPADTKATLCPMSSCHSSRSVRGRLLCKETKQLEKQEVQNEEMVLSFDSRDIQFCRKIEDKKCFLFWK